MCLFSYFFIILFKFCIIVAATTLPPSQNLVDTDLQYNSDKNLTVEFSVSYDRLESQLQHIEELLEKVIANKVISHNQVSDHFKNLSVVEKYIKLSSKAKGSDDTEEDLLDGCILSIRCDKNIQRAVKKYYKFPNAIRFIKRIVVEIYQENSENVDNIIKFIDSLEDVETKYLGIWSLQEEILLNENYKYADKICQYLQKLKKTSEFKNFTDFDQRNALVLIKSMELLKSMDRITLEDKLNATLAQNETEKKLLTNWQTQLQGYLLNVDSNFKNIYNIAQDMKGNETNFLHENKAQMQTLKEKIPTTLRNLVWEKVCIRKDGQNYVYIDEEANIISGVDATLKVYLLTNGSKPNSGFQWTFDSQDRGDTFSIKNVLLNQFLYTNGETYASSTCCRKLLLSAMSPSNKYKWTVTLESSGTRLRIKNKEHAEGMYSDSSFSKLSGKNSVFLYSASGSTFALEKC